MRAGSIVPCFCWLAPPLGRHISLLRLSCRCKMMNEGTGFSAEIASPSPPISVPRLWLYFYWWKTKINNHGAHCNPWLQSVVHCFATEMASLAPCKNIAGPTRRVVSKYRWRYYIMYWTGVFGKNHWCKSLASIGNRCQSTCGWLLWPLTRSWQF